MNSDLTRRTAAELAEALASGETTSVEITQAHLDRIAAVDADVHAFLHVDAEGALAQARASDERRAEGRTLGPLDGVPVRLPGMSRRNLEVISPSRFIMATRFLRDRIISTTSSLAPSRWRRSAPDITRARIPASPC
jgi:hypothetical protein